MPAPEIENEEHESDELSRKRQGADEMDERRRKEIAYQYLCRLEEAKKWIEAVLHEELPPTMVLEERLRNGVYLAKLGHFTCPETVALNRIYDIDQTRYEAAGLQFRHTDNINLWLSSLAAAKLSKLFHPETTDVYDKKNMPRVIYCLHALARHLFRLGRAPLMSDLYGHAYFTDEEIDTVSAELRKYGIQMPAFQKIGGLLSNEMPVDKAALHAAIIAINEAVDGENSERVLTALQNPAACLSEILPDHKDVYHKTLKKAKATKVEVAHNRSLSESFEADVYDELLTQVEIQGHLTSVNVLREWRKVKLAVEENDAKQLLKLLNAPVLGLKAIQPQCSALYLAEIADQLVGEAYNNKMDSLDCRLLLQRAITAGNCRALEHVKSIEAVWLVNEALSHGGPVDTLRALQDPALGLFELFPTAAPLYHEEMLADKQECGRDLSLSEIRGCIHLLSKVAAITHAVDARSTKLLWEALCKLEGMLEVEPSLKDEYLRAFMECRERKFNQNAPCPILTFFDIHDCINGVHKEIDHQNKMVAAMDILNRALAKQSYSAVMSALRMIGAELKEKVNEHELPLYYKSLQEILETKAGRDNGSNNEVWLQDVQQILKSSIQETEEAKNACTCLMYMHRAMEVRDKDLIIDVLRGSLPEMKPELSDSYCALLMDCHKQKVAQGYQCPVVVHVTSKGHKAYLNLLDGDFDWSPPEGLDKTPYLSLREVQKLVAMVNSEDAIAAAETESSPSLDEDQEVTEKELLSVIVKIQSWWRGVRARRMLAQLKEKTKTKRVSNPNHALAYYKKHVGKVILIQSLWRGRQVRKAFHSLVHQPSPSMTIVRRFVSFLTPSQSDYERETQIQNLKSQVVKAIRLNQQLSQHIDDMDVKIGLLVQNRISLQDVQAHGASLNSLASHQRSSSQDNLSNSAGSSSTLSQGGTISKGLKSLTKEGRHLLEGYQNLFYLLQTRPQYLSKLLFCLPHSKSMHFLQNVIFSLYNFGSNPRDEYLLLKLLRSALEEEIKSKFQKPIEVLKVYPQVLKIAINFSRDHSGHNALRTILGSLVQKVLNDKNLAIDTNPVDIYKSWMNQMETSTGQPSELPRVVSQEEALSHEEVRKRLELGISQLKTYTTAFLDCICSSDNQLPYSLLYTARTLYNALVNRFPGFPEKDLLKVIGNVIYYHFINAAIVAPDAYDIVTLPADRTLTAEQRCNLASIAKILQYAASKKGFGEESRHLTSLNPFIIECHEKFKRFLKHCCQVEELEEHFGVHAYTEATLISKPTILISIQEIWDTHQLVLQYEDDIAPNPNDILHVLLEDLGPLAVVRQLLGGSTSDQFLPKGELFLTLCNSKLNETSSPLSSPNSHDNNQLFTMSKELLISILPFLPGNNLALALDTPEFASQENQFTQHQHSLHPDQATTTSLKLSKMRLRLWLSQLERQGLVSAKDNYQALISAIAKDICTRGQYCQARANELQTLKTTMASLEQKTQFYQKQAEYYNMYIRTCLENLDKGKKRVHRFKVAGHHPGRTKSQKVLRYTAAQLHEKGVLQQMRGLTPAQFKSVQFVISPTESVGVFEVKGCFMGIEMERVDIDIQHLLQLQYEGKAIMEMFGKVQINVNLLLFLLNKKFYGKSKS